MEGIGLTILLVVGLDLAIHRGAPPQMLGVAYLVIAVGVTCWSGLRAGVISVGLIAAYLFSVSHIPASALFRVPIAQRNIVTTVLVYFVFVALTGLIQGRLRSSAMREFDAWESAEAEAAQRLQAEQSLQTTEDKWQLVVNSAMDAIITMEVDGQISLWNPSAEAMFGWSSAEILGRTVAETIVPRAQRGQFAGGMKRFLETGESSLFGNRQEFVGLHKNGSEFPIELAVVPYQTETGFVFIAFVRDVTEQKKLNQRLRQAQKMEAIGTLAAGIAHDFNNIVAAIAGNIKLLEDELPANDSSQESVREIAKAATRASEIVRQILAFSSSRISETKAVSVAPAVREAIELLRKTIPPSVEIECLFETNLSPILIDETDLHQIILNLGINAMHAMPLGGRFQVHGNNITLDEATARSLLGIAPGKYVRISVGDTGCGMDTETVQRVFDPFFTTKAVGEGTGLGLSVVYGIVERHQGAITVYSELNKGTVFHLYFPAVQVTEAPDRAAVTNKWVGNGEHILYVDDDEALVYMLTRMLKRLNYVVSGFQSPTEALAAFRENPDRYAVAITDMSMPQMDGPELVRELRKIRPDLRVVMVTGYIREQDIGMAEELGVEHLILKPTAVEEMSDVLHSILEQRDRPSVKRSGIELA